MEKLFKEFLKEVKKIRQALERIADTDLSRLRSAIFIGGNEIMETEKFIGMSKKLVADYATKGLDVTDNVEFSVDNVYVVWLSKTLQNSKALLSTTLPDGMYYELTYNGDKNEIYFDAYKKIENIAYQVD